MLLAVVCLTTDEEKFVVYGGRGVGRGARRAIPGILIGILRNSILIPTYVLMAGAPNLIQILQIFFL